MKRTFALLLCAMLALGVSACGDDRNSAANGSAVTENGTADNGGVQNGVQPEANGNTAVPEPGDGASESILPDENRSARTEIWPARRTPPAPAAGRAPCSRAR